MRRFLPVIAAIALVGLAANPAGAVDCSGATSPQDQTAVTWVPVRVGGVFTLIDVVVTIRATDPGPAGLNSVEGIDSDGDCFRDDLRIYIDNNYGSQTRLKNNLYAYVAAFQNILKNVNVAAEFEKLKLYGQCLSYVSPSQGAAARKDVLGEVLNTGPRNLAYWQNLAGANVSATIPPLDTSQCP